MRNLAFAIATAVATAAASPARADVLPLIPTVPDVYYSGYSFEFELRAPALADFTSFNFDVIIETPEPDPLSMMTVKVTRPPGGAYAFGSAGTFQAKLSDLDLPDNQVAINISGATAGPGVNTFPGSGTNDLLARVQIIPGYDMTGDITISINPTTLRFERNVEITPQIEPPESFTVTAGDPAAVPVPAAWVTLGLGGLVLTTARRRFGKPAVTQ